MEWNKRLLAAWKALLGGESSVSAAVSASDSLETYTCNICGTSQSAPRNSFGRESGNCVRCGSTVRLRGMMYALSVELLGKALPLPEFPVRLDLQGIGLSDWEGYAQPLAACFGYENTYYHCEPRFDICELTSERLDRYDFLVSSDVFEHVPPPARNAFVGAASVLRPGGLLVFSVPYSLDAQTREHFPELHDWHVEQRDGRRVLINRTTDDVVQEFTDLCFHGGDGETLEMRVFCESDLLLHLAATGFEEARVWRADVPEYGIYWTEAWSLPITARRASAHGKQPREGGRPD